MLFSPSNITIVDYLRHFPNFTQSLPSQKFQCKHKHKRSSFCLVLQFKDFYYQELMDSYTTASVTSKTMHERSINSVFISFESSLFFEEQVYTKQT